MTNHIKEVLEANTKTIADLTAAAIQQMVETTEQIGNLEACVVALRERIKELEPACFAGEYINQRVRDTLVHSFNLVPVTKEEKNG